MTIEIEVVVLAIALAVGCLIGLAGYGLSITGESSVPEWLSIVFGLIWGVFVFLGLYGGYKIVVSADIDDGRR